MFTWVCPKCGSGVPPSYRECPNCLANQKDSKSAVTKAAELVSAPGPVGRPSELPGRDARNVERKQYPDWLWGTVAFVALVGGLLILYTVVRPYKRNREAGFAASASMGGRAAAADARPSGLVTKYLELSGLRLSQDSHKAERLQFLIVNHSAAYLPELKLDIHIRSTEGKELFDFPLLLPALDPYESREFSTAWKTAVKGYDVPDWQLLRASFEVRSR